ncbi:TolC family protein [Geosporobacter ferrireducens]|uniref:Transporter n=1 Tax=Geosporobacter ferrireducens TaxID=1424294 RepID=A0A1D8GGV9_9FIRM|nr:TolC family protein [Geosporobacter ferrireducens]AOT70145.1 hypothetical protein Gferi_11405 [Geosporobacter ferrireducens]
MKLRCRRISAILVTAIILNMSALAWAQEDALSFSIEEAVKAGVENSIILKLVKNQIDLNEVQEDIADEISQKLNLADKQILGGSARLSDGYSQLQYAIDADLLTPDQINEKMKELEKAAGTLNSAKGQLDAAVQEVISTIGRQLGMTSSYIIDVPSARRLLMDITKKVSEVSQDSYDTYKNQIALQIQKSYYDVLKNQKMIEVKKKAMERAEKQYNFTKDSYELGMKSKDDMLLAKVYYIGTQLEYEKAQSQLNTDLIELKKHMNIPLDQKIVLTDVLQEEVEDYDLHIGLNHGISNRLEIKKAMADKEIHDLNVRFINNHYSAFASEYKEAALLRNKAGLNLKQVLLEVESSIRQSHELMKSTGGMLELSRKMVDDAKENVEIAELKYQEGFNIETSLLKKLDIESTAGTIVEVLAAEENLAQIEQKQIEIIYGYNLIKMKYLNDIGDYIY